MRRLAGLLSKEGSFAPASKQLSGDNVLGVKCSTKKMQRLSTRLGEAMEADRAAREPEAPAEVPAAHGQLKLPLAGWLNKSPWRRPPLVYSLGVNPR